MAISYMITILVMIMIITIIILNDIDNGNIYDNNDSTYTNDINSCDGNGDDNNKNNTNDNCIMKGGGALKGEECVPYQPLKLSPKSGNFSKICLSINRGIEIVASSLIQGCRVCQSYPCLLFASNKTNSIYKKYIDDEKQCQ